MFTDQELRFIYGLVEHGSAPSSVSIKKKLAPMFAGKKSYVHGNVERDFPARRDPQTGAKFGLVAHPKTGRDNSDPDGN